MGYYSNVDGEIAIVPPIQLRKLAGSEYLRSGTCVLMFRVEEEREETAEGTLLRESVVAIAPSTGDLVKAYSLADDLAEMASEARKRGSACAGGWIIRTGERQGDVERYRIGPDDKVVAEKAALRWPDGTVVG